MAFTQQGCKVLARQLALRHGVVSRAPTSATLRRNMVLVRDAERVVEHLELLSKSKKDVQTHVSRDDETTISIQVSLPPSIRRKASMSHPIVPTNALTEDFQLEPLFFARAHTCTLPASLQSDNSTTKHDVSQSKTERHADERKKKLTQRLLEAYNMTERLECGPIDRTAKKNESKTNNAAESVGAYPLGYGNTDIHAVCIGDFQKCWFSKQAKALLIEQYGEHRVQFVDVSDVPGLRECMKTQNMTTVPQVWVHQRFITGGYQGLKDWLALHNRTDG